MEYIQYLDSSVKKAFESMFDEAIELEGHRLAASWIASRGVTVIVGITGERKGRVLLDMPLETAGELAKKLDPDSNDEDFALFTVAEFCNIASGGATTLINNSNREACLRLAPPSIFTGMNAKIFSPNMEVHLLSYSTRLGKIDFHIGFEGGSR